MADVGSSRSAQPHWRAIVIVRMSKAGFSLIEVMVAVAITSIVGAMIVTLMGNMGNMSAFYSAKEDYDAVYRTTQLLLLNEKLCENAFRNNNGASIADFDPAIPKNDVEAIYVSNGVPLSGTKFIKKNEKFGPDNGPNAGVKLRITDIYFTEPSVNARGSMLYPNGAGNPPKTLTTYIVNLNVKVENLSGGPAIQIKPIPLTIALDGPGKQPIKTCYANASNAAVCAALHADINAAGQCVIPECSASMAAPPPCPVPAGSTSCVGQVYFLAYTSDNFPTCRCVQTCNGPEGPKGDTGDKGDAGAAGADGTSYTSPPIYTY